jgi:hypothetical protein
VITIITLEDITKQAGGCFGHSRPAMCPRVPGQGNMQESSTQGPMCGRLKNDNATQYAAPSSVSRIWHSKRRAQLCLTTSRGCPLGVSMVGVPRSNRCRSSNEFVRDVRSMIHRLLRLISSPVPWASRMSSPWSTGERKGSEPGPCTGWGNLRLH